MKNKPEDKASKMNFFKRLRIQKGLTQSDVSNYLGYSTIQLVSNFERGLCTPTIDSIPMLAELYSINESRLREEIFRIKALKIAEKLGL